MELSLPRRNSCRLLQQKLEVTRALFGELEFASTNNKDALGL
jgi:hypothetical protein